ncbi:PREDICTED: sorting nexin-33-like [Acropora digitifera]|uniref:sorting nexin-33-like n=1 Tax=Acropora digitifera TaxID=70779 RepID=UPI00077ABA48|nr:PREDICTED: sorting nexin-33-like [Acropora digitifera]
MAVSPGSKVRVLYDFEGDAPSGELIVYTDEILTVTRTDVGDGWWEGIGPTGHRGLFPEAYVEVKFEDHISYLPTKLQGIKQGNCRTLLTFLSDYQGRITWRGVAEPFNCVIDAPEKKSKFKGIKSFIAYNITPSDYQGRITWRGVAEPFNCVIDAPEKKSKFKGIKSFIAYNITPSNTGVAVSRRYKHFDWLYDRFLEKFTLISVPPLPDKQITGRFGDEFIGKRKDKLQMWMNRICLHPVLSQICLLSPLCCKEWKQGKRKAECDKLVGASFFSSVDCPQQSLLLPAVENRIDQFGRFIKNMDDSVKGIQERGHVHCEKCLGSYRTEYKKIGSVFSTLSAAFAVDEDSDSSRRLTEAVGHTGRTYDSIGELFAEQPQNDFVPLIEGLKEYSGMLSTYPDILQVHKVNLVIILSVISNYNPPINFHCDKLVGASFFNSVDCPQQSLSLPAVENRIDQFGRFIKNMDDSVKGIQDRGHVHCEKCLGSYRTEYKKIGSVFSTLSAAFAVDEDSDGSRRLTEAVGHTGRTYDSIGELFAEQPQNDFVPLIEGLKEYSGMLSTYPDILQVHKGAITKVKECEKLKDEEKMEHVAFQEITTRADTITNVSFAEMSHFHDQKVTDFKNMMQHFLQEQISFHQRIIEKLGDSLKMYDKIQLGN